MRLQSVILPDDKQCTELYYRGELSFETGDALVFDTYFNSFSYTKYREYTTVDKIDFTCNVDGRALLQLCLFDGAEHKLCEIEGEDQLSLSLELSKLPNNGFVYPKLIALTRCRFLSGEYSSSCKAEAISVCAAICTYKREEYVLNNIELLKNTEFSFINKIFVIDNGNTLDGGSLSDEYISVIANKNYGGSGGFTRGLIEAYDRGFSHVILMDDDVEFHPEILEKMTAFISLLKDEYSDAHFATGMLSKNYPYIQYELGGADWNGRRVCKGKHELDIRSPETLLSNLTDNIIGYGAWWCFLMPVSDIKKYGLPYPFFIKLDDVEYGLRTCKTVPIITMNGVAVRHDDFDNKYSAHLEYYNVRNQLVLNIVQGRMPLINSLYRLFAVSFKHLALYRYDTIPMILKAFDDYLSGVDFFLNCDSEALNSELIRNAPKLQLLSDIPQWNENMRNINRRIDNKILSPLSIITMAGHIIPSFMLKSEIGAAPFSRASSYDTLFRKSIIQYQLKGDTGIVTKRSFGKFVKYSFKVLGMAFKLLINYHRIKRDYRSRMHEINSLEFWRKHLSIE